MLQFMNLTNLIRLRKYLSNSEIREIAKLARKQQKLENRWNIILKNQINHINDRIAFTIAMDGHLDTSVLDMSDFFFTHRIAITHEAIDSTSTPARVDTRMAKKPEIPKALKDLIKKWDIMRATGRVPKAQQVQANKIKTAYLKKLKELFKKHGMDFVRGNTYDLNKVRKIVQEAGNVAFARAKTTVATETTRYFNETRTDVYDRSPDVTHYLFMSIRDGATTKWCRTRHGLVFTKGSELFNRNKPPCHWWCRSEVLPLTPQNPRHLKLIKDLSRRAENNKMEPLPKGWNAA